MNGCGWFHPAWLSARINIQTSSLRICPPKWPDLDARITLKLEEATAEIYHVNLGEVPASGSAAFNGARYIRKLVPLPVQLPLGYHDLEIQTGGVCASTRLIVAPDRAYLPDGLRAAGVALALYGIRSERNWGCGDFRDLQTLTDWVADEVGASFVALNPLHAIHNRRPFNTSPYLPNSVFYQNWLYLDVETIPDFTGCRRAQRLLASPEVQREIAYLRATEFVEYERVHALKIKFLKLSFASFLREHRSGSPRARQFQEYINREGDLLRRFATYCALDEWIHLRNPDIWLWTEWPEPFRDPESAETEAFRKKHWRLVLFYQYLQWQIDVQLAAAQQHARDKGLSIGLYHDLALATDRYGSDLWAHRSFFATGCRVGSPPDDFSPKGQDWAFPPPNSARHRESGYRLFVESIRKNCRHGGALRIDHVMRFFRLYWIPDGADAAHGAYVRDHWEDLIRIVALESVRHRVIVVGEDLGTVEPEVRETLARFGILGYRLLYFEKDGRGEFRRKADYPQQALVSSTTHDLPTLAGFWSCEDIEARRRAGVLPDEASYRTQLAARAEEKQKMLDVLLAEGLLPPGFPRYASRHPGTDRRIAQRRDRLSRVHPFHAAAGESGRPHQRDRAAKSSGDHVAVSQLEPQDAFSHRRALLGPAGHRFRAHVSQLDRAQRTRRTHEVESHRRDAETQRTSAFISASRALPWDRPCAARAWDREAPAPRPERTAAHRSAGPDTERNPARG